MEDYLFAYEYWGNGAFSQHENMGIEQYLIERIGNQKPGGNKAALRFYTFNKDSIVLGYAQATDVIRKLDSDFGLARRVTGGSHVQTGPNIIAYSFVVPRDGTFRHFEDMRKYYASHVAGALEDIGLSSIEVDNKASIINVGGRPIAGHAIYWGIKSAMLHGLIALTPYDVNKINSMVYLRSRMIGNETFTEYDALRNSPAVSTELNGSNPENGRLRQLVGDAILRRVTEGDYTKMKVGDDVLRESLVLLRKRLGREKWVSEREPPLTTREVEEIPGEELAGNLRTGLGYCLYFAVEDKDFKKIAQPI
ncbi:MAG: lipoate--protein ligase family protein [Candidatus Aenigmarchaeota archaeon]|nr:lipoate--protein ligase family protein [Candidatus Aenigmarchaeota archaeon]